MKDTNTILNGRARRTLKRMGESSGLFRRQYSFMGLSEQNIRDYFYACKSSGKLRNAGSMTLLKIIWFHRELNKQRKLLKDIIDIWGEK